MEDYINRKIGDFEISNRGIERVIEVGDYGNYTTELIVPKEIFVEACQKWILKQESEG